MDKAVLLATVDQLSEEHLLSEVDFAEQLRQLAGEEDVLKWQQAIAHQMQQCNGKAVSLLQLQRLLGMPLMEIWLGLLLGEQENYQWETSEEFYSEAGEIWLNAS